MNTPTMNTSTAHIPMMIVAGTKRDSIRSLKSALEASEAPLPHIFVVGDHAPPFLKKDPRLFFNQRHVPWYVLTPKGTS